MRRYVAIISLLWQVSFSLSIQAQETPHKALNPFVFPVKEASFNLVWGGDTLNKKWDPYASLLIPIKLRNCPKQFYMQFDLGAPSSILYRDQLKQVAAKYPTAIQVEDSTGPLYDLQLISSNTELLVKQIDVRPLNPSPINWNKKSIDIIGTFGADLIAERVTTINYAGGVLSIGTTITATSLRDLQFEDFVLAGSSVLLPCTIKGKYTLLYFDTGSSSFELISDESTCRSLAIQGSIPEKYGVQSWNKTVTARSLLSNDSIKLGGQSLCLRRVTYFEGFSSAQTTHMKNMGIGGMIGNRLFLNAVVVLDMINRKFAIAKH